MRFECDLKKTEAPDKVEKMIRGLCKTATLNREADGVTGQVGDKEFWEKVDEHEITPIVRQALEEDGKISFGKIPMVAGKLSVDAGFPLGAFTVYP